MNKLCPAAVVFLAAFFLLPIQEAFADGGGHKSEEKKAEESATIDPMYSAKEVNPLSDSDNDLDNMLFSPTDLFTQDELVSPDPMPMEGMKMEGMKMEGNHNAHQEAQVELSQHERVSSSSKGFGTAVGITLFAGLVFAGLTYMRSRE